MIMIMILIVDLVDKFINENWKWAVNVLQSRISAKNIVRLSKGNTNNLIKLYFQMKLTVQHQSLLWKKMKTKL
jgi:hypothetical protein